jgi:hypothetical protein
MLPPGFYNQVDKDIYAAGDFFIPQERFRAAPYNVNQPNNPDEVPAGIPAVYQAQGGSGGGGYTGGISDLTGDFFKTISDRQNRLTELNRPLAEAQFPSFKNAYGTFTKSDGTLGSNIENAQNLYNQTYGMDPNAVVAENFSYKGITDPTAGQINKMAAEQIQDFQEKYRTGQLGSSYIPAEKPTINRRIQDAIYSLPFLSKPQSADQIIAEGYTGQSNMPGILSMMLGSMDKYGDLPRGDQAFIARNMGYTGPTVFGDNSSGLSKDVFGMNTRSALGNYAERVGKEYSSLGDSLSGRLADKYGVEFDEETGMFVGTNAAKANQMTKMMRAKYNFYKKQTAQRDADRKAAEEARMKAYQESQMKKERDIIQSRLDDEGVTGSNYNQAANITGGGGGDTATYGGQTAREATYDNDPSTGTAQGYSQHYMDGGIVDMLEIYD